MPYSRHSSSGFRPAATGTAASRTNLQVLASEIIPASWMGHSAPTLAASDRSEEETQMEFGQLFSGRRRAIRS